MHVGSRLQGHDGDPAQGHGREVHAPEPMSAAVLLLAHVQQPAADTDRGRPCTVVIDSVRGKAQQVEVRKRETNVFAGGGVFAHCQGTGSSLSSDSVAWFAGIGRFDMIGQKSPVHIRDTAITLDAQRASYFLRLERLDAQVNVVAVNRKTGSVLRGPNLTYYRAARGVRDTLELYASSRPTIEYRSNPDSGEPYVIVADRVRFKGNDRMWGGGRVTIDRSDIAAQGDSMQLDETAGQALLIGRPRVAGKGARPYTLVGTRIEMELALREVRKVKALGHGAATGADWRLTADTIHLAIEQRKLQQVFAWGDSTRPHAVSTLYTILADSLALDLPNEVLTEARAYRKALATSKKDSTAKADVNWIAGDTIVARWAQVTDSAGPAKTKLRHLQAHGSARSFSHLYNERDSTRGPSIDYSRGQVINIAYRDEFLKLRAYAKGSSLPEAGSLSVDDARTHLQTSVLPRLAVLKILAVPAGVLWSDAPVAFTPEAWREIPGDREPAAAQLLEAAERAVLRAEAVAEEHPPIAGASLLETFNLVKIYKNRRVVNDVSVRLEQGEIVGLLGPNGAGKTTTFYMMTGLVRPDGGRIALDGRDLTDDPMYRRARMGIGYLAQEPSVFRKLTVEQNLLAILETLPLTEAQRAARLEQLLDELGIKHLRRQRAFQLSGGERRRLEITRALVTEPKFMLLDEPFAGVDPIAVHDIQTIVAGLRHRGIGVLITDHNVEQTLDIVDRAYIMFEGKVQVSGSVRELVFDDRVAHLYLGPTLTARLRARLTQAA